MPCTCPRKRTPAPAANVNLPDTADGGHTPRDAHVPAPNTVSPSAAPPAPMAFYSHGPGPDYSTHRVTAGPFAPPASATYDSGDDSGHDAGHASSPMHIDQRFPDSVHPCDRDRVMATLAQAERDGLPYRTAFILQQPAGDDRLVCNYAAPRRDTEGRLSFEGVVVDIAALRTGQDELLQARAADIGQEVKRGRGLVGKSPALRKLKGRIARVASSSAFALILGESGVGKELVARAVHESGPRAHGPFIAVNCAAVPDGLMESLFFGHRRGAFSGADRAHEGLFEQADGGTLFLDEIGDIPLSMQTKLLRVLDGNGYIPVGGSAALMPDVRLIGATNRDLDHCVTEGSIRADFLYRVNMLPLHVPPLRERMEDIPLLLEHFLKDYPAVRPLPGALLKRIMDYHWPGNVRELRNMVMRHAVFDELPPELSGGCAGGLCPCAITSGTSLARHPDSLSDSLSGTLSGAHPGTRAYAPEGTDLRTAMATYERRHITAVLERVRWNRSKAADLLGIDRRTLYAKMHSLGLTRE